MVVVLLKLLSRCPVDFLAVGDLSKFGPVFDGFQLIKKKDTNEEAQKFFDEKKSLNMRQYEPNKQRLRCGSHCAQEVLQPVNIL